ncbi:isoprenylcysteine carboxylmethyltransferase family protein [Pararhizobium sp. BT-229]|uniref:methyltransferase family protein n=1 Tax=Pararhizobium sp. BT-229 TaxID=2986923 RepID=UPI0021F7E2E5|nr:isoprenylcysteine carboxylmethyltransferase family protein [Pararhizobium sp. BT-229]MCV9967016.1 isoprenylcysteine carboxylmethyltransferase family protein [Pararhizobium sp. BT-229]
MKNGAGTVASAATRDRLDKMAEFLTGGTPVDGESARAAAFEEAAVLIDAIDLRFPRAGQSGDILAEGVRNMEQTETPQEPSAMSGSTAIAYAIGLPLSLLGLIFLPAGTIAWRPGWIFLAVLILGFGTSALVLARVNPVIYRARSRIQTGTKSWDKALLAVILPAMMAVLAVAALDAGRFHWSAVPPWAILSGYGCVLAGIAGTAWAQAVNPFFEPGVRIQSERHQRVIDVGPYRFVRHPGYVSALFLFFGMALALGSFWALAPAALAAVLLVLRTSWQDRLLRTELPGYDDYSRRVRSRLVPGVW